MIRSTHFIHLCLILFGISAVFGAFNGHDTALGLPLLPPILLSLALYAGLVWGVRSWRRIRWLAAALLLIGAAFALYFILQYGYQGYTETPSFILAMGRLTTFLPDLHLGTIHPNAAAAFVEGLIPLAIALLFSDPASSRRPVWGIIAALLLYVMLLSFSRGGIIALAALPVLLLMSRSRGLFGLFSLMGLVALAGLYFFAPAQIIFDSIFTRWELYRDSFYLGTDYLFTGLGLGENFTMAYSRYAILITVPRYTYSHNLLLTVWLGQGLLGLLSFSGLIVAFYAFVSRVIRQSQPRRLFHGAWLGVSAILIHGLFEARQYIEVWWVMPLFFALLALSVTSGNRALRDTTPAQAATQSQGRPLRWAVIGLSVIGLVGAVIFQAPLRATWESNLGALRESQAELAPDLPQDERHTLTQAAITHYQTALSIDAEHPNAARRLGNLYAAEGDFAQAIPLLESAYKHQPAYAASIKSLGLAYANTGQLDAALNLFQQLDDVPEMREELLNWGYHYYAEEEHLRSAYAYEIGLRLIVEDFTPEVWVFIGDRYRDGGDPITARQWYTEALTHAPEHPTVLAALATLDD